MGGAIYVTTRPDNESLPQPFHRYELTSNVWTRQADIPPGAKYLPLVSTSTGRHIYALSKCSDKLAVYTPEENLWRTLDLQFPDHSTPPNFRYWYSDEKYYNNVCEGKLVLGPNPSGTDDKRQALYLMGGIYKNEQSKELFKLPLSDDVGLNGSTVVWQKMAPMLAGRTDFVPVLIKKLVID